jgi:ethanolamine ammonia-lyase small subunit
MSKPVPRVGIAPPDPWQSLTRYTAARIGLGRAGGSVPTASLLAFQLAHARARDAVHQALDGAALEARLRNDGWESLRLTSAAGDRRSYIQRPDLGRILGPASKAALENRGRPAPPYDVVFVVADGLSAVAVERHAAPLLKLLRPALHERRWTCAPVCIVEQGRVAIADEIGALLPARLAVILIGERPGLSSPDSLGLYLTWDPVPGRTNAERNCISNVRPEGLSYAQAAHKLLYLMTEAQQRQLSGIELKEDAVALPLAVTSLPAR